MSDTRRRPSAELDASRDHPIPYANVRGWYGQNAAWLASRCAALGIKGYSRMTRHQMIEAIVVSETRKAHLEDSDRPVASAASTRPDAPRCEHPCGAPGVFQLTDGGGSAWLSCGRHVAGLVRFLGPCTVEERAS